MELSNTDTADFWVGEIGVLEGGETLLNSRISLYGCGSWAYPGSLGYEGKYLSSIVTLGVTMLTGGSDPGAPVTPPSEGLGYDWQLRDAMGWSTPWATPGTTSAGGEAFVVPVAANPYVSRGMRKVPVGEGGYVYACIDVWNDESPGPSMTFSGPPAVVYSLIVADAA